MCESCGCSAGTQGKHAHAHHHDHGKPHHHHGHGHDEPREVVPVGQSILSRNDRLAEQNRGYFAARRLAVLNLVSSPGSGKTAILERTLAGLGKRRKLAVIVGDLATDNDARRLREMGSPAVQISTGTACHLDAHMVQHALEDLDTEALDLLFIENVGNLVCPASFDLGEDLRVVVISVTEGEDKPLKYPVIFQRADVVLVNKIDLAAAVGFNREALLHNIAEVAPAARVLEVSARTGQGLDAWFNFLEDALRGKRGGS